MVKWKDIPGYVGYYQVSSTGCVRSMDRSILKSDGVIQRRSGRICTMYINEDGYVTVKLSRDAATKVRFVHRLVYEAFAGQIADGFDIDHIDFDRTNNNIDNLQAVPHADNVHRTAVAGRHYTSQDLSGEHNPNYGNHKLSKKYAEDKELALQKQSRRGARNGRATRIELSNDDGFCKSFDYIRLAADFIKESGCKNKIDSICLGLSRAAKDHNTYFGYTIRFM